MRVLVIVLLIAAVAEAGSLDPSTNAPAPTMHTLKEIYDKISFLGPAQTLSATSTVIEAGYYDEGTLDSVDSDLTPDNIVEGVELFGVVGTAISADYPAAVPKTGQTTSYAPGDDGALQRGVQWPNLRFTDNGDGTVTDHLTGLIWLKNANAFGERNWTGALAACATLNSGEAGLTDGSVEGDWRLPNLRELFSLLDYGRSSSTAAPRGAPFSGVVTSTHYDNYFSSTTVIGMVNLAWAVNMRTGRIYGTVLPGQEAPHDKNTPNYIWPVRGPQP